MTVLRFADSVPPSSVVARSPVPAWLQPLDPVLAELIMPAALRAASKLRLPSL